MSLGGGGAGGGGTYDLCLRAIWEFFSVCSQPRECFFLSVELWLT